MHASTLHCFLAFLNWDLQISPGNMYPNASKIKLCSSDLSLFTRRRNGTEEETTRKLEFHVTFMFRDPRPS